MKVKRFVGATEAEVLAMARLELGPCAVILDTKKTGGGIAGMFGSGSVEILAAVEDSPSPKNVSRKIVRNKVGVEFRKAEPPKAKMRPPSEQGSIAATAMLMLSQGTDPALSFEVAEKLNRGPNADGIDAAVEWLMAAGTSRPAFEKGSRVAFVGPTGSGKTTTAAKICAEAKLRCGLSTVWLAADVYRAGGVEQAATYADIMEVPLEVCPNVESTHQALSLHADAEYAILDTTGRSHLANQDIVQIAEMLDAFRPTEVHLTIPAATAWQQVLQILEGFMPLRYNRIIVTKLDEVGSVGTVLNLAGLGLTPLSYFTTGQTVPDDLCIAGAEPLMRIIREGRCR